MFNNTDITVINTVNNKYAATPILGVALFDKNEKSATNNGIVVSDYCNIQIDREKVVCDLIPYKTYIAKGIVNITGLSPQQIFEKYSLKTVISTQENYYGSRELQHLLVICK